MTVSAAELSRNARRQLRVPKGNGPRSGRFMDDPRTQAADLADKLAKHQSPTAPKIRAIADRLAGLEPSAPEWFTTLTSVSDDLRALTGLPLVEAEAIEALAEELDFMMLASWDSDFEDLGFEEDWADIEELSDFSEFEEEPLDA